MSNCCHKREQVMDRARRVAEEMLAHRDLEPDPTCEEEPEALHTQHPLLLPHLAGPAERWNWTVSWRALARQNQLLLDILSSVNALSAAVLSIQSRM